MTMILKCIAVIENCDSMFTETQNLAPAYTAYHGLHVNSDGLTVGDGNFRPSIESTSLNQ